MRCTPLFTIGIPCSTDNGYTCYYFALGPADFATIYNVAPLWLAGTDGTGQTIAVVGETNINPQDVADFRAMFGLPANPPNIILNGPDPGINADEVEADLDVQWSGAVAKGATIDLVVSESTETTSGIDLSALYIIDNNLAPVMSESYGECEAHLGTGGNQFYNTLWEQAAAQGITVIVASGDSGSAGCDSANRGETAAEYGLSASGLASTAFNVAVGGTDFSLNTNNVLTYWSLTNDSSQSSAKSYIPESTWNDSCAASGSVYGCTPPPNTTYLDYGLYLIAGGGGPSSCTNPSGTFPNLTCSGNYSKPPWQSGAGVPRDGARDIPDVSLFAGNGMHFGFYVMCQMDANASTGGNVNSCGLAYDAYYTDFQAGSGTSASAQVFAGVMALVNQRYGRQGNANYVLYPMAAKSSASCNSSTAPVTNSNCIFYDVTLGNNSVICQGGTPDCSNATSGQYGIMVYAGSPAYPASGGYDLATGLGSVNVANLVNNWTSSFTPSTTDLSLSTSPPTNPITLTHGQPVNFTINVAPGSGAGTPTGDVSLIAQTGGSSSNANGIGPFTLSGGSVSNSTTMLPGGSYNVTAHYAGNETFGASDSSPGIPVTVGKESSLTEIRLVTFSATAPPAYNVTTAPYGSPYVLRMDVTNSSGQLCASVTTGLISYPCPTGALTVSPAPTEQSPPPGTVAGSYTLNSQGYAEDQPIQQSPGTHNFVASYAGDNSYAGSTSPTLLVTITQAPTTTAFTGLSSSIVQQPYNTLNVTVSTQSSGLAPTGKVQLLVGSTPVQGWGSYTWINGSAKAPASLQASLNASLPLGPVNLTAQYPGDSNYTASTSATTTVNVTDFSVAANPSTINIPGPGQSGTATLSIAPISGFTGTVDLSCGASGPGISCTVSPSSVTVTNSSPVTATLTVTTTPQYSATPPAPQFRPPPSFRLPVGWLWTFAGFLALGTLMALTAAGRRRVSWLLGSALLLVGVWVACGGGGGAGGGGTLGGSLSPTSLSFGQMNVGSSSKAQSVTLTSTGSGSLAINTIGIGPPGEFSETDNCGSDLAGGSSCTINVTFSPSKTGPIQAPLEVWDQAPGSPQSVNLSGTGVPPATPPGSYQASVNGSSGGGVHNVAVSVNIQ